jgi:hypothetical protein
MVTPDTLNYLSEFFQILQHTTMDPLDTLLQQPPKFISPKVISRLVEPVDSVCQSFFPSEKY